MKISFSSNRARSQQRAYQAIMTNVAQFTFEQLERMRQTIEKRMAVLQSVQRVNVEEDGDEIFVSLKKGCLQHGSYNGKVKLVQKDGFWVCPRGCGSYGAVEPKDKDKVHP